MSNLLVSWFFSIILVLIIYIFRLVHLGPGISSILAEYSTRSVDERFWSGINIPKTVSLMVCSNVFHNNPRALSLLPPRAILVEYGFQVSFLIFFYQLTTQGWISSNYSYYKIPDRRHSGPQLDFKVLKVNNYLMHYTDCLRMLVKSSEL